MMPIRRMESVLRLMRCRKQVAVAARYNVVCGLIIIDGQRNRYPKNLTPNQILYALKVSGLISGLDAALTDISWYAAWKYLRTAPSLPLVRSRLDEVLVKFPKSRIYIDFLWRNVATWATCAFTWELDYGFQASSMQEGELTITMFISLFCNFFYDFLLHR